MERKSIKSFGNRHAKNIKTEADLKALTNALTKLTVERASNIELPEHLGHDKHQTKVGK